MNTGERIFMFIMVIISAISVYVAVSCYTQITDYDSKLVSLNVLLNQQSEISTALNEEDLLLLKKFDSIDKRFKEVDEKIRVNEVRITELGAKIGRKK